MSNLVEAEKIRKQIDKLEHKITALLAAATPEVRELVTLARKHENKAEDESAE